MRVFAEIYFFRYIFNNAQDAGLVLPEMMDEIF